MVGAMYVFYQMTNQEISVIRENINKMDANHREDMRLMDSKWERMDSKWERLFERLLIQDKR